MRLLPLSAALLLTALAAAPAAGAATPCPKAPKRVVAKAPAKADGYAYVVGGSLFGCGRATADRPLRVYKLGPWTPASQALFTDGGVIWTERRGAADDRIWVSALAGRPSVRGLAAARRASDRTVAKLLPGPAWVTTGGAVAVARSFFQSPDVIGAGTPGAAGTNGASGLVAVPKPAGPRLELGRWGADAVATLAATLSVTSSDVDADGCSAVSAYEATVVPVAGQPAVGVSWQESTRYDVEGCQ